jgi:hypothetical protein
MYDLNGIANFTLGIADDVLRDLRRCWDDPA